MPFSRVVRPDADASTATALEAVQVATAYNYPLNYSGAGFTAGIIELGGGVKQSDLNTYFGQRGVTVPKVVVVTLDGATNSPSGANGADAEVLLDIEVAASVAPSATFRVYFAPNTDQGFLDAINHAVADGCDVISISWGGPEDSWATASLDAFDAAFKRARDAGVTVFCAAGDSGSSDGEFTGNHVDFPASSPNVVGCGGTRLTVDTAGHRATETTWDDNPLNDATGGGVSVHFPGRDVPDVAGNADPVTGYNIYVDGQAMVVGGTSAVAPLYTGLALLLSHALGERVGKVSDFVNTVASHPQVCFDVTQGNNGGFRAGPGRDEVTGFGVVDGAALLAVYQGIQTPAPPPPPPTPTPDQAVALLHHIRHEINHFLASLPTPSTSPSVTQDGKEA